MYFQYRLTIYYNNSSESLTFFTIMNQIVQQIQIQKTLRLQDQQSSKHEIIKLYFQYLPRTREINLSKAIRNLMADGYSLEHTQLFYWDYDRKMFVYIGIFPFKNQYYLKYENFQQNVIHIRYRKIKPQPQQQNQYHTQDRMTNNNNCSRMDIESKQKKNQKRVKERSISEVIQLVSKWRNLYQLLDSNNKRTNTLQSAARQVGISKKTLDDYFLQLKYGEAYNFDFKYHKNAKIGVLRAFVKANHKSEKKEFQPLKMLSNCIIEPAGTKQIEDLEINAVPSSDQQQTQDYLFHRHDSFEFRD